MSTISIVVDDAIPFIDPLFHSLGQVEAIPAKNIDHQSLKNANALVVRSVTQVNRDLLKDTPVEFVGSATIGTEHINVQHLERLGVSMTSAPGCNAMAVVQYVLRVIAQWSLAKCRPLDTIKVGIVGVGNIGRRLDSALRLMGCQTLLCDPPRHQQGTLPQHMNLTDLVQQSDIVSLHTPLTSEGPHSTEQFFNGALFNQMSHLTLLINAARGNLIEASSLLHWMDSGGKAVLDVWPNEPELDTSLLEHVWIGTPHIAGYSVEGKLNASYAIYKKLAAHFQLNSGIGKESLLPEPQEFGVKFMDMTEALLASYVIEQDHHSLQAVFNQCGAVGFESLRKNYSFRREFVGQKWRASPELSFIKKQLDMLS